MLHDVKYTVAENIGQNSRDIKNRKSDADKEWLDCFKTKNTIWYVDIFCYKMKKHSD